MNFWNKFIISADLITIYSFDLVINSFSPWFLQNVNVCLKIQNLLESICGLDFLFDHKEWCNLPKSSSMEHFLTRKNNYPIPSFCFVNN